MPHNHHHTPADGKRLTTVVILNLLITAAELIGGLLSNSLSLVSDALHNFSDALAVIIAWVAIRLNQRPPDQRYTFGFKRAEVLAASVNAGTLVAISLYLLIDAVARLQHPEKVEGLVMTYVALIGLAANVIGTYLLHRGAKENTNLRAVYLHLFSDAMSSLGVVVGGVAISCFGVMWLDPILTILISLYILKESIVILKRELDLFMLAVPPGMSLDEIKQAIMDNDGITGVHHVHLWEVDEGDIHLEAHIKVQGKSLQETDVLRHEIEHYLHERFGIHHVTLQVESDDAYCETSDRP